MITVNVTCSRVIKKKTESTELQAFKRQKDGYKVTVVVYDSKRWQVGTPCVFHSR